MLDFDGLGPTRFLIGYVTYGRVRSEEVLFYYCITVLLSQVVSRVLYASRYTEWFINRPVMLYLSKHMSVQALQNETGNVRLRSRTQRDIGWYHKIPPFLPKWKNSAPKIWVLFLIRLVQYAIISRFACQGLNSDSTMRCD